MQLFLVGALLLGSLFLQGTLVSVPLLVSAVVISSVMFRSIWYVLAVFILGIAFDVLTLQRVGQTSLYLLALVVLIELYDRKFETRTLPFVLSFCFLAIGLYLIIFGSYSFVVQLVIAMLFAAFFYFLFVKLGFFVKEK